MTSVQAAFGGHRWSHCDRSLSNVWSQEWTHPDLVEWDLDEEEKAEKEKAEKEKAEKETAEKQKRREKIR